MPATYIQWYNENERRAYPVSETVSRKSDAGNQLPDSLIVDIGAMLPPEYSDAFISSVRITSNLISIGISTASTGLLAGTFATASLGRYAAQPLTALVDNVSGWIAFGDYQVYQPETYIFSDSTQSGLSDRALRIVDTLPVTRISRLGGSPDQYANGLVHLEAGQGIIIEADETDPEKILIKLQKGIKHAFLGPCNESARTEICGVPPIRSINGVCPDENGVLTIRFE